MLTSRMARALDMMHGAPAIADQLITAGAYEDLADADLICITAGLRRKPDESRPCLNQSERRIIQNNTAIREGGRYQVRRKQFLL